MTTKQQDRAGIYERVSRKRKPPMGRKPSARAERERGSIEQQNAENTAACEQHGWVITRRYTDPGISASRFTTRERPDYEQLLTDIAARKLDVLVLWESSRGSRELEGWGHLIGECRRAGVKIYITADHTLYDPADGRDERSLGEDAVDAAYESAKTSKRCRRAATDHAKIGRPHGLAPYGYLRRYDEVTREFTAQEPDPDTAPVVADIITRVAGSEPIEAVTRDLNTRGIPSPRGGTWTHATTRWICLNVTYIGKRKHNGGPLLDGDWPPVSADPGFEDVFWAGVALLTGADRKVTRPARAKWLLSLVAECEACGGTIAARENKRTATMVYTCRTGGCTYAPLAEVDKQITGLVIARLSRKDAYAKLAATDDQAVTAARAEAARLRAVLGGYKRDAIAEKITRADFAEISAGLGERIAAADKAAQAAAVPAALRDMLTPGADVAARWAALGVPARKDVLRCLFERITIAPATTRERGAGWDPDRVDVTWRAPGSRGTD